MSSSLSQTLILTKSRKIYGVGNNDNHQLFHKDTRNTLKRPTLSEWIPNVRIEKVFCGYRHSHLLDENGNVWAVGSYNSHALGLGPLKETNSRVYPPRILETIRERRIVDISSGDEHSLFLDSKGNLLVTGDNNKGQLGIESSRELFPVQLSFFNKEKGRNIKVLQCGERSSSVLLSNGDVYIWGLGFHNTPNIHVPTKVEEFPKIDYLTGGYRHILAYSIEENSFYELGLAANKYPKKLDWDQPPKTRIVSIASGRFHNFILLDNGELYMWGTNTYGQLNPTGIFNQTLEIPTIVKFPEKQVLIRNLFFSKCASVWSPESHFLFPISIQKIVFFTLACFSILKKKKIVFIPKFVVYHLLKFLSIN
eukprot:TRINITY_DN3852_c0_g1_i1.p1 TRINITY_DN3852_c0_g1~~TRINITY_DN3852_c0_g1_i1.p1  ORF type:complete len:403 (+),score=100.93 TRINITY_DN3852_c0_g1_i1:114-1211(+)